MNPNPRSVSIFTAADEQLGDLNQELHKVQQQLFTLQTPKYVNSGMGTETENELCHQGRILKLKLRQKNLQKTIRCLERMSMGAGTVEGADDAVTFAMEAIINYRYRPALVFDRDHLLRKEDIESLGLMEDGKRSWKDLINYLIASAAGHPRGVSSLGRGVARVEHANGAVVGTAWSFGRRQLLSNRHVFLDSGWYYLSKSPRGSKWKPLDGRKGMLNFTAVEGIEAAGRNGFEVDEIVASPGADASRIITDSDWPFALDPVLDKSELVGIGGSDDALKGRLVAVIGHPTNKDGNPTDEYDHVFGGAPLKLKRFMPGRLSSQKPLGTYPTNGDQGVPVLMHDCSTLKGASGSCVIDLGPADLDPRKLFAGTEKLPSTFGKVIGLHFGGLWSESNFAVPTWTLSDTLLKPVL